MSDTTPGYPVGATITVVACPWCASPVPVACGDVAGLRLDEMIAIALAKADRHHDVGGQAGDHLPVPVSLSDATPPPRYLRQAAEMMFPAVPVVIGGSAPFRPDAQASFRRRSPEETRRLLRESNLPASFVTRLLEDLGIPET